MNLSNLARKCLIEIESTVGTPFTISVANICWFFGGISYHKNFVDCAFNEFFEIIKSLSNSSIGIDLFAHFIEHFRMFFSLIQIYYSHMFSKYANYEEKIMDELLSLEEHILQLKKYLLLKKIMLFLMHFSIRRFSSVISRKITTACTLQT